MNKNSFTTANQRRGFLKKLAGGTAILGVSVLSGPLPLQAAAAYNNAPGITEADEWFKKIKGKHRMVFDVTQPHHIFPFAWPKVFIISNEHTGTPEKDCSAVVVLRHNAIAYAMENSLWAKYKFGDTFKIDDHLTRAPALRNPFWQPKPGEFTIPGMGDAAIGINELQSIGVMFCVCDMAMTVNSAVMAQNMNLDAAEVKKEWLSGLLPNIQVVPSGVWAVGRAQEHGCAYCFAS